MKRMLEEAARLTWEEAGGHGRRWSVLLEEVERSVHEVSAFVLEHGRRLDDPPGAGVGGSLLYCLDMDEHGRCGVCVLLSPKDKGEESPSFVLESVYPVFNPSAALSGTIGKIECFPNGLEARLWPGFEELPYSLSFFDTHFALSAGAYETGQRYRFGIAALAYRMEPLPEEKIVIDDPEEVRHYRACELWMERFDREELDEKAALALYDSLDEKEKKRDPIVMDISRLHALLPGRVVADDAEFAGEVVEVQECFASFLGEDLWRVDIEISEEAYGGVVLPFYLTNRCFSSDWRPKRGEFVRGVAWLQGRVRYGAAEG